MRRTHPPYGTQDGLKAKNTLRDDCFFQLEGKHRLASRRGTGAESGAMNPQDTSKITEVVNDTEIYRMGESTQTVAIELPMYLPWVEFVCLLLVVVFGLALYGRKRQPCVLLLPLGALFLAASLAWVLGDLPVLAHWHAASQALNALAHMHWLRPVGALLLAVYALMQWCGARKS